MPKSGYRGAQIYFSLPWKGVQVKWLLLSNRGAQGQLQPLVLPLRPEVGQHDGQARRIRS